MKNGWILILKQTKSRSPKYFSYQTESELYIFFCQRRRKSIYKRLSFSESFLFPSLHFILSRHDGKQKPWKVSTARKWSCGSSHNKRTISFREVSKLASSIRRLHLLIQPIESDHLGTSGTWIVSQSRHFWGESLLPGLDLGYSENQLWTPKI